MLESAQIESLRALLDHAVELDHLGKLREALKSDQTSIEPDASIAIGLDANVLLNLGKGRKGADIVDYLSQRHEGPVIVPAQALLEFWNSQLGGIYGLADRLRTAFESLSEVVNELDPSYRQFADGANALMEDFQERYGHVLDEKIATQVITLLDGLQDRAIVPYVPRSEFADIAERRHDTKTPPGFKDKGHGDFFIWAEFLHGLQLARQDGAEFTRVVLVTDDKKPDWSTKGTSHPILRAEVGAFVNASFDTWGSASLDEYVANSLSEAGDALNVDATSAPDSHIEETPPTENAS